MICSSMFPDAAPCPGDQRPLQYYTVADDPSLTSSPNDMFLHVPRCCTMIPDAAPCPSDERPLQYYIVADDAFLLQENLMKPFYHKDMIPSELNLQLQNIAGPNSHGECIWHHEQPFSFFRGKITLEPSKVTKIGC